MSVCFMYLFRFEIKILVQKWSSKIFMLWLCVYKRGYKKREVYLKIFNEQKFLINLDLHERMFIKTTEKQV